MSTTKGTYNGPTRVGAIRPSQAIHSYGVGALIDLPNLSVMVGGLDRWDVTRQAVITEERLLSAVQARLGPQVDRLLALPAERVNLKATTGYTATAVPGQSVTYTVSAVTNGTETAPGAPLTTTVTVLALDIGYLMGSIVIVEEIFAYPGLGRLMIYAVANRDIPLVQGTSLLIGAVYVAANLIADLVHAALNPRIGRS